MGVSHSLIFNFLNKVKMSKITNRFVHFKTKASFTSRLGAGDIQESSVVFIQDANEIWTHGTYYKCNISRAEVEALITSKGYITEADIPSLTGGAAATSGQYVSGVTVSGHTVTVTKAALPTTATKLSSARTFALTGAVTGSTSSDLTSGVSITTTLSNVDASKITSGTLNADRLPEIPISKIPAAALERLYVVESQSAAMSLTIQEGDVVQIGSGGPMYFCVSESASTFATKFKVFTAGAATSVPWSGVTNKPNILSLGETSTTAYAGDKGALNRSMLTSLGNFLVTGAVTAPTTTATTATIKFKQIGRSSNTSAFGAESTESSYVTIPAATTTAAGLMSAADKTKLNSAITSIPAQSWSSITGKPTTLDGYGITDAIKNTTTATATTLAAGASATAVYDKATNKFTFGIPRGATGATGNTGAQGPKGDKGDTGATGPAGTYTAGSGISISGNTISAEIPVALPNPYALTINGQSYTGSSAVSISTSKPLSVRMLTSSTINAGYSYSCGTSRDISTLNGFSSTNPDSVIISSVKLTFTASNAIKMDGLADLSGTYYIYCLSYMANGKIAVNGATYA